MSELNGYVSMRDAKLEQMRRGLVTSGMLLLMSSRRRRAFEYAKESSGEEPFEATHRLAHGLAFA
jgi:hypothetical protein